MSGRLATRLVIVRHGQTAANTGRLLHGWSDLPLDETGRRQATLVAHRIANEIEARALISSPLTRARATAAAISDLTGLDIEERA
jgi:probable phosphoglycerate mutase